jgi:AraC-like DNA-binding protein
MSAVPAGSNDSRPRFTRHPPGATLAAWVECYWSLTASHAPASSTRVLPDGSSDIIVDLAGPSGAFVVGTMRRAELVPLAGRVDLLGVRFRPGAALPFLDVPLRELADRQVGLDALWGRAAEALTDELAAAGPEERRAVLERALVGRLRWTHREDELTARAVALLRHTRGGIGIRSLAMALGVGERRLQRAFDRGVGVSPKRLARVLRFLQAVRWIGGAGKTPGAALALDAGYADQPHFVREFKALAGVTPAQYAAERRVGSVQDATGLSA